MVPGPGGGLITCSGCRHPELPTQSRDLPVGAWGVFFSMGGATLVSQLGNHLPINLTVKLTIRDSNLDIGTNYGNPFKFNFLAFTLAAPRFFNLGE